MHVQLLLDNHIVELDSTVSFPLNKTFDNLNKPTDILVDYTKSIAIPATAHNNKILGNAYRLDKQFSAGDATIGLYMNPLKRIPAKLLCNNEILFDGYAKYVSSTQTNGITSYNMNLYGAVGDVFQSLMGVVLDVNKLSDEQKAEDDGGAKYILNDGMISTPVIDRKTVKECWDYDGEPLLGNNNYYDVIGFAPAYRGYYDNFESNSIVGLGWNSMLDGPVPTNAELIEEALKNRWISNIKSYDSTYTDEKAQERVDAIDINALIGNGVNEHSIQQFRSYEQKPYIYFCRLMMMYQNKCKELTGYDLKLDSQWFNANNPYWTKLCYMFDYLSGRGVNEDLTTPFSGYSSGAYTSAYSRTVNYTDFSDEVKQSGKISLQPFDIVLKNKKIANSNDPLWSGKAPMDNSVVQLNDTSYVTVDITITNGGHDTKTFKYYAANNKNNITAPSGYTNFIGVANTTEIDKTNRVLNGYSAIKIPAITIPVYNTDGLKMTITVSVYGENNKLFVYRHTTMTSKRYNYFSPIVGNSDNSVVFPNTNFYSNWRLNTTCALKNLYTKDEPLFKVILEYTKMFGLVWKPDYTNKTVTIMTRQSYFKDYEVVDWTDKFDGTQTMTIEPVTFASKYINFDYDNVDGFRYTGYKNKYGTNYGGKHIKTRYEFDNKSTEMLSGVQPSSVSTKSYIPFQTLVNWNTFDKLEQTKSPINFIDCENPDQSASISMNNWYFRGNNIDVSDLSFYVSDASTIEKETDKYFWVYNYCADAMGIVDKLDHIPSFSIVSDTSDNLVQDRRLVGCVMNCPNEDFTDDKSVTSAINNYIYDICWKDYINERYDSCNKKVTCYFTLSYNDFNQFNFNKLIKLNNQLFVVNKICDFEPNTKKSTKVELIQVSNIDGYTSVEKLFPVVSTSAEVAVGRAGNGSIHIYVRAYPTPDSYEIVNESGTLNIDEITSEPVGCNVGYFIYYYDMDAGYRGRLKINGPDYTYEIPIEIN